ncbi:MAG TPA: MoxR family ATPase [Gemmatimonadales bacterium]|nr:MoxR family ATPase [Gemmatimonadales bacterium]
MSAVPAPPRDLTEAEVARVLDRLGALRAEVAKVVVGQRATLDELLMALLAGGHCLLEGVPGLAKTLMIRTLADAVALTFRRIQFTPDLMPTDILGTEILEEDHATGRRFFKFTRGPVFANVVLADEINRTAPKTQAALLEAMQEGAVTYAGTTYPLERPFFVLATQNPIEQAGTYPLPEAQLDRFLLLVRVGYPSEAEEIAILARTTGRAALAVTPRMSAEEILRAQAVTRDVAISDDLLRWTAALVRASRPADSPVAYVREWVRWGAGPRAGQALVLTAKARAVLAGRFAVTLDDLRAVASPVLRHRVLVNFRAEAEGIDADAVTARLLREVPEPRSPLR